MPRTEYPVPSAEEVEHQNFVTPGWVVDGAYDLAMPRILRYVREPLRVLDAGAGSGIWGEKLAARPESVRMTLAGIDIRELEHNQSYHLWKTADFLTDPDLSPNWDWIIGNPPYGRVLPEQFVRRALSLVTHNGYVIFLLRLGFLEGGRRAVDLHLNFPAKFLIVCGDRPSFAKGATDNKTAYGVFIWQKGFNGQTSILKERIMEPKKRIKATPVVEL